MAGVAAKKPLKKSLKPKKKLRPKQDGIKSLLDQMEKVDIGALKLHPENPREGDVGLIAESLDENGQYTPIVVQQDTGHILRGNHTWLAARSLGWKYIHAVFVDVDDDEALKILLADNKTGMAGGFNDELLARILKNVSTIKGTGYDRGEADAIIERSRLLLTETVENMEARQEREREAIESAKQAKSFDYVPLGEEDAVESIGDDLELEEDEDTPQEDGRLEKAADELSGAFQLKEDLAFSGKDAVGEWGLPRLRSDMLMTWDELPENLKAWAGSATKDWPDPDQWWLYNFGTDSTSGMRDVSKLIVSFYSYDNYFENWWFYPKRYVTKLLNSGIKYAVMPDFSMHTPGEESRVLSLWSLYRNRWLACYMQEAGLKVIPNITWATEDEDFLKRHIIPTLPKKIPLLAIQIQTVDEQSPSHKKYVQQLQYILDTVKPDGLLLYYGKAGKRIFDNGEVTYGGQVKFVASRQFALSEQAKKREKKKTL
jgi:ParB-like chromosome segregation protein Spo0J